MTKLFILLAATLPVAVAVLADGAASASISQEAHGESAECRACVEECSGTAQQCRGAADARHAECVEPCRLDPDAETGADCYRSCRRTQRAEIRACDSNEMGCIGDCHPNPESGASRRPLAEIVPPAASSDRGTAR